MQPKIKSKGKGRTAQRAMLNEIGSEWRPSPPSMQSSLPSSKSRQLSSPAVARQCLSESPDWLARLAETQPCLKACIHLLESRRVAGRPPDETRLVLHW